MSVTKDESLLHELKAKAAEWVEETLSVRLGEAGVDETKLREQLEEVAAQWVKHNLYERSLGMKGTPNPGYHMLEGAP